jgi:hypothetical protein
MKKLLSFTAVLLVLFIGCSKDANISSPIENQVDQVEQPNWIALPGPDILSVETDVSVSQMVNGSDETLMQINTGYAGGPHGWISITANARFQRNSFLGQRYITMSINDQFGTATFSPSGSFLKPVIYNLTIMGVDLSNVDPTKVRFVYLAADGNYYIPPYQSLYVEKQSGKLQIINAQLPHFSRYGFVN